MEMMSNDISKLAEALSKMQGAVTAVTKNKSAKILLKSGSNYSYTYADLSGIWDAIRSSMTQFELSISQIYFDHEDAIQLTTILMHSSGQWIKSFLKIPTNGLKIQEVGSAMTYNRRYALSAILGISADDDDDGAIANETPRQKKSKQEVIPTPQAPVEPPEDLDKPISSAEAQDIENMIDPKETEYRSDLLKYFSNLMKVSPPINDFYSLPRKHFVACMKSVKRKHEDRLKKERGNEEIDF